MAKNKCTPELIKQASVCKKSGMSDKDIMAYLGIGHTTFYRWIKNPKTENQREFRDTLKESEAEFKHALQQRVIAASNDTWQAAAWMLERRYPEEYGRKIIDSNVKGEVSVKAISDEARREMNKLMGIDA